MAARAAREPIRVSTELGSQLPLPPPPREPPPLPEQTPERQTSVGAGVSGGHSSYVTYVPRRLKPLD